MFLAYHHFHIHSAICHIAGKDNTMADARSRLTHLSNQNFFLHLQTTSSQINPWCMLPLSPKWSQHMTPMLHRNISPKIYLLHSSIKTPTPGTNGEYCAAGFSHTPIFQVIRYPVTFLISFQGTLYPESTQQEGCPSGSGQLISSSNLLAKCFPLWGITIPD